MLTMIALTAVSTLLMLIIAGVFPVPCQEYFDFEERFATFFGYTTYIDRDLETTDLFDSIKRNGTSNAFGGHETVNALDIFCWF